VDEATAERYEVIREDRRRPGILVPANDLRIAASAARHGLVLITRDSHFAKLPQVRVEHFEPRS
jgi:tRNA(fMet)-specific endonuclease VapC